MANQNIDFKDPGQIIIWLETALRKEQEKYKKCPVIPDVVTGYEMAQGWGYVVVGYFLAEESFKALLYLRGKQVPSKHSLTMLFKLFEADDQATLREFYTDYWETIEGGERQFPFKTLDEFLANLDGDPNKRGNDYIGSFDWRYFLIEETRSQKMPKVSVEFLHEIAYGCIRMAQHAHGSGSKPSRHTHSWRMYKERYIKKYRDWLKVQMKSQGWDELGDRLEILWGPDYRDRYDFFIKEKGTQRCCFAELPQGSSLPELDKRQEIKSFTPPSSARP